jgi:hypothetical protein
MVPHKVVGRYKAKEFQKNWCKGKPGVQAKKRVYSTLSDFLRYSPELIKRWEEMYVVEVYKMDSHGNWKLEE